MKKQIPQLNATLVKRQIPQIRRDIQDWKKAVKQATSATEPKQFLLQELYSDITNDALLTSQLNNRNEQTISAGFEMINPDGKINEKATATLNAIHCLRDIAAHILNSEWYGCSLIELFTDENNIQRVTLIDRSHIVPDTGMFFPNISNTNSIAYREVPEYGSYLLEFNSEHLGMLNKAVNHILFKKFAQSCWSELCEIYGIPPRYIKTNTQDQNMLDRAENMMRDVGAAAWFIIDTTEEFQFAQGVNTDGDVYANLIKLCNNETSLLVSGAIIGQDTEHGNRSKEQVSVSILDRLIESDKRMVESYMNAIVLPAFRKTGWMPNGAEIFRFSTTENTEKLWNIVKELLPHKEVDNKWLEEKFGVPVSDKYLSAPETDRQISALYSENRLITAEAEPGSLDFFE